MDKAITAYFEAVPDTRKPMLESLHRLILGEFPEATVDLKYRMPTYTVGDGWVAIANQKHYVSLYTCGYHHISAFKEAHPKVKTGKGCINFKETANLHLDDLRIVVRHALLHPKDQSS